eukprot:3418029-Prorocentrum_lima.AAC.1
MTSSLVGSEMCIRDRWHYVCHVVFGLADGSMNPRVGSTFVEEDIAPVSYTHLTLPTICSV